MLDSSKVVHFWRTQHRYDNIFGEPEQQHQDTEKIALNKYFISSFGQISFWLLQTSFQPFLTLHSVLSSFEAHTGKKVGGRKRLNLKIQFLCHNIHYLSDWDNLVLTEVDLKTRRLSPNKYIPKIFQLSHINIIK